LTSTRTNLSLVAVGDITDKFLVPAYQRGYRWTEDEVRVLLDDLSGVVDKDYCLQAVVVKKLPTGEYELIDGQQRITTLYLVFLYLKKAGLKKPDPPFSIKYATRPESEKFLADLDVSRATENIDFFHLANAYKCIEKWFTRLGPNKEQTLADDIFGHLHKRAKVIWYEASSDVTPAALFARLNVGRIPLTNAELVKALFLGKPRTGDDDDDHQIELGTQWDIIERDLHDPLFWSFLTNRDPDQYPTRIQLLFELLAEGTTTPDRFHTFHYFRKQLATRGAEAVWRDVAARHDLLKDWYEDRDLYHFIGFLIASGSHDELRNLLRDSEGPSLPTCVRQLPVRSLM
jgi:hypothetical protein